MLKLILQKSLGRQLLGLFLILFYVCNINAQDYVFSQYYNAPLQLNPAFAGNATYPSIAVNYRNQWPGINTNYVTYAASYDQFFNKFNSGIGLWFASDDQGDGIIKQVDVRGIYSYKLKFNNDFQLKIGLEAGFKQTRLDWDKLVFYDQLDPFTGINGPAGIPNVSTEIRPDELSKGNFDVATGFLLYSPKLFAGLSLKHINNPYTGFGTNDNLDKLGIPVYLSLHAGYQITMIEGNKQFGGTFISPNVLFAKQGDFYQINVGAYMQMRSLFGGMWLRHTFGNIDAFIFSVGFDTGTLKIGYSFDLTTSNLGLSTGGSHELGILIKLKTLGEEESKINDCLMLFR